MFFFFTRLNIVYIKGFKIIALLTNFSRVASTMKFRNFFMILFLAIISSSMASALRAEQKSELDPADLVRLNYISIIN